MNKRPTTIVVTEPRLTLNWKGKEQLFSLTEDHHILGRFPEAEDPTTNQKVPVEEPTAFKVPMDWEIVSRTQGHIIRVGNDYYIYDGDRVKPSRNGLYIKNTRITPQQGYLLKHGDRITVGQNPQEWVTIIYTDPKESRTGTVPSQQSVYLKNKSVLLGRDNSANLYLDAPTISRRHAVIDTNEQGKYILHDHSANGVFVNDQKVNRSIILEDGDSIRLGPYTFVLQGDLLVLADQGNNIRLDAKNLVRIVKDKKKQNIRILNDISLAVDPGQLVALVGGSGSGKSTLMKTLLGIAPSNQGGVYLNGNNLRNYFNIYRTLIGYVPQQDIVHTNLTVKEVLFYAAKLRLPKDIDIEEVVQKTLRQTQLTERQNTLVKELSGGQLKRVSIGVELLADPKLFFLDEPTSGLDPGLDKRMMVLLRDLANEGRTVILVTHATNNLGLCDQLVVLGVGGNLCYFGPPSQAKDFFEIQGNDLADIYLKLETEAEVIAQAEKFKQSQYKQEYIDDRLGQGSNQYNLIPKQVKPPFLQQIIILIKRYFQLLIRDKVNLFLSLLTAPIGIGLIILAIQKENPFYGKPDPVTAALALKVLFVFTCAAIWVGFASSLQEIVKESAIYMRERLVNLGLLPYLGSKVITLGGLSLIQSLLITIVILIGFKDPRPELLPWSLGVFITTFLTLLTAVSLGLTVSAAVKNTTQANSALPILLLPQIIFAGVLFEMKNTIIGRFLSWLMLSRWSVGAYGILVDVNNLIPPPDNELGVTYDSPIKASPVYDPTWENLLLNWGLLLLQTLICLGITTALQKRKDYF
jgi:ABC-type multidrug transport system ATPase subunit